MWYIERGYNDGDDSRFFGWDSDSFNIRINLIKEQDI